MRKFIECVVVSAAVATALGCGESKPAQEPAAMTPPPPAPMPESRPTVADPKPIEEQMGGGTNAGQDTTTTKPAAKAETPLTDGEIVAVTSTANTGEIEMGQLASKTATSPDVKNYAAMMVTQHRDMEVKGKNLATKAKITPAENEASSTLKTDAQSTLSTLKGQKGKEFDKSYIDAQVKAHLAKAEEIQQKLESAPAKPTPTTKPAPKK